MTDEKKKRVFLGLGGNLGEPLQSFKYARRALADHPLTRISASSPVYRTPPVGGPEGQPDYLNAVLEIETALNPLELLGLCRTIENSCGRTRDVRWEARTLDIDLLFCGQIVYNDSQLILPHPRLHNRHFVLLPLLDLAPDFVHPQLQVPVRELLARLPEAEDIVTVHGTW